jgi:hypothetical protein
VNSAVAPQRFELRPLIPRVRVLGLVLVAVGAIAVVMTHSTIAAVLLLVGVGLTSAVAPRATLIALIALLAVHPLAMRVVAVDLGIGGLPLVLISAWKEVALSIILVMALARLVLDKRNERPDRIGQLHPFDALAIGLVALVITLGLAQHSIVALNAGRLLLFPVGVYVAIRLGVLRAWGDLTISLVVATGIALFGIVQSSFLGWGFVASYWGISGQSIPYTFTAQSLDGPRSAGTLSSPVEFGTYLAILVAIAVATLIAQADRRRLAVVGLPFLMVALTLTFSRSAMVAAVVGGLVLTLMAWWRGVVTTRVIALLIVVAVPAAAVSGMAYVNRGGIALIQSTLITIGGDAGPPVDGGASTSGSNGVPSTPAIDGSTVDHIASLQEGVRLVVDHPFGVGLGNVGSRTIPGSDQRPQYFAESWYLTMGLSLGWLGLVWAIVWTICLAGLAVVSIRRGTSSVIGLATIGTVATVCMVGVLLPTLMEPQIAILPWALAALAVQSARGRVESADSATAPIGG